MLIRKAILRKFLLISILFPLTLLTLLSSPYLVQAQQLSTQKAQQLQDIRTMGEQECVQPPRNADFFSMTDDELALYGLPNHQIIQSNAAQWKINFANLKLRTCGTSPSTDSQTHEHQFKGKKTSPVSSSCTTGGACLNPSWAGPEDDSSRGVFRSAYVNFTVPNITSSPVGSHVSIWAGVGGDPDYAGGATSTVLVQAGVDSYVDSVGHQYNESWWEVANRLTQQNLPLSSLRAGDQIAVEADSNYQGSGYDYFYIENGTVGSYNSKVDSISSDLTDGASAECIVERNFNNTTNSLNPLANFGTENMSGCTVYHEYDAYWYFVNDLPYMVNFITGKSGTIAGVGPITNGSFSVYWDASS